MMVVVMLIGILCAIAIPSYLGAQKRARIGAVKNVLSTIWIQEEKYFAAENMYYPFDDAAEVHNDEDAPYELKMSVPLERERVGTELTQQYEYSAVESGAEILITATPRAGATQADNTVSYRGYGDFTVE